MKKILKVLAWILAAVVVLLLTLPLWIGLVVKPIAGKVVPAKTGTNFRLGEFALNPYVGRLTIGDMQLWNPQGYDQKMALTVGRFFVDVDMSTVCSDTIVIEAIELNDIFISYVKDKDVYNVDVIMENLRSGRDLRDKEVRVAVEREEAAKKLQEKTAPKVDKPVESKPASEKPAKKFIINKVVVKGTLVQWGKLTLPMPTITLTDIGRKSNGASWDAVRAELYAIFLKNLGAIGVGLRDLGVDLNNMAANLKEIGIKDTGKALDAIKDIKIEEKTKQAIDAIKVKDAAQSVGNAIKGIFGN